MFSNSKLAILPSALLVLGALSIGCGGDDDGGSTVDSGTPSGGDGGVAPGATIAYEGTLVSILAVDKSMKIGIPHQLELLNNDTGAPLVPPITTTSEANTGTIKWNTPATGSYTVWVKGVGTGMDATYDSLIVNATAAIVDPLIRISNAGTLALAENTGGYVSKPDRAPVTGSVYWAPKGVRMGTIGCAKIIVDDKMANDTEQDQRYNSANGLPARYECGADAPMGCVPQTSTLSGGRFYIANMTEGAHTLKVSLDNGATTVLTQPFFVPLSRAESSSPTKSVLVQIGLDIVADTKPVVPGCATP